MCVVASAARKIQEQYIKGRCKCQRNTKRGCADDDLETMETTKTLNPASNYLHMIIFRNTESQEYES